MMVWDCPKCGARVREKCGEWGYGSPFRVCPKCGEEYFDKRRREPAVQGFHPRSENLKFYILATLYAVAFTGIFAGHVVYTVRDRGSFKLRSAMLAVIGVMGIALGVRMIVRIKTGAAAKSNAAALEESKERMKSSAYVHKLMSCGYDVPVEYIKELADIGKKNGEEK